MKVASLRKIFNRSVLPAFSLSHLTSGKMKAKRSKKIYLGRAYKRPRGISLILASLRNSLYDAHRASAEKCARDLNLRRARRK